MFLISQPVVSLNDDFVINCKAFDFSVIKRWVRLKVNEGIKKLNFFSFLITKFPLVLLTQKFTLFGPHSFFKFVKFFKQIKIQNFFCISFKVPFDWKTGDPTILSETFLSQKYITSLLQFLPCFGSAILIFPFVPLNRLWSIKEILIYKIKKGLVD